MTAFHRGRQWALPVATTPLSHCLVLAAGLLAPWGAHAQTPSAPRSLIDEQRQLERERALRRQQEPVVDARLPSLAPAPAHRLPDNESPCFPIDRLVLAGERADDFQWLLNEVDGLNDSPVGRCLGTQGVNIVIARLQQALVERGWVTTRVLAAPQDLSIGTLVLTLVPGRVAEVRLADPAGASTSLRTALPLRVDDTLNLRGIEQGLENLKRLPTAEADIQIEPTTDANARPGDSDLVVKYARVFPLRATLSLDDEQLLLRSVQAARAGELAAKEGQVAVLLALT
jgi:hemolysin activation/secretion protein